MLKTKLISVVVIVKRGLNGKQNTLFLCGRNASFGFLLSLNTLSTCHTQRPQKFVESCNNSLIPHFSTKIPKKSAFSATLPLHRSTSVPHFSINFPSSPLRWLTEVQGEANRARACRGAEMQRGKGGEKKRSEEHSELWLLLRFVAWDIYSKWSFTESLLFLSCSFGPSTTP